MITEQVLNDLKQANEKVVNVKNRFVTAKDIIVTLSTINLDSYNVVSEYIEYNGKTLHVRKWLKLCDEAGI